MSTMDYDGYRDRIEEEFDEKSVDTGWRVIPLLNGFQGTVLLRRINRTIHAKLEIRPPVAGVTFNGVLFNLPVGFRTGTPWVFFPIRSNGSATWFTLYRKATELAIEGSPAVTDTNAVRSEVSWLVADNEEWPTVLPGTPASQNL